MTDDVPGIWEFFFGFPPFQAHLTSVPSKYVCNAYTRYRHSHVAGIHFPCPKGVLITSIYRTRIRLWPRSDIATVDSEFGRILDVDFTYGFGLKIVPKQVSLESTERRCPSCQRHEERIHVDIKDVSFWLISAPFDAAPFSLSICS